ncbi:MAG: STAS domain-containing protein [Dehalococcoidales bacterium]|nr:STAS domain-containing protein [Dehalococcoidales bacterium]
MEIQSGRKSGILIVSPEGRLDAFEASKLGKELDLLLNDEDSYLVMDMARVPYLSSGGLRVLVAVQKKLSRVNGLVLLCGITDYPLQVLKMAGLDILFTVYDTVDEAVDRASALKNIQHSEKDWRSLPCYRRHDTSFHVFHAADRPASVKIVGNLMKLMHAALEPEDIRQRHFSDTEYSIGLGALGGSLDDCLLLLGEMITIGGTMVWLPTDGNDTPDFLIPQKDTGEVVIHTGLNLALEGGFNDIILIGAENDSRPISISDLYESLFDISRERRISNNSLVSLAMVSDLEGLFSSGVKISPVKQFAPANNGLITDPENISRWMDVNTKTKHAGRTMVSFGLGLDLASDLSGLPKKSLDNMFYLHPSNIGSKKMMLHNHGVIFEHLKWQYVLNLDNEIKRIVRQGEFVDMRHLLDTTCITRAIAGVSYISGITPE